MACKSVPTTAFWLTWTHITLKFYHISVTYHYQICCEIFIRRLVYAHDNLHAFYWRHIIFQLRTMTTCMYSIDVTSYFSYVPRQFACIALTSHHISVTYHDNLHVCYWRHIKLQLRTTAICMYCTDVTSYFSYVPWQCACMPFVTSNCSYVPWQFAVPWQFECICTGKRAGI